MSSEQHFFSSLLLASCHAVVTSHVAIYGTVITEYQAIRFQLSLSQIYVTLQRMKL